MSLKTICPVCDQDIEIDPGKIVRSFLHLNETNGVLLVGCTNCCRSLKLPSNVPTNGAANVEEWATKQAKSDSWLECIPLLEQQLVKEPNGVNDYQGEKVYTPGGDTEHLRKYPYMFKYGVDPECMWAKMKGGDGKKPFVIK
jgi:hypothetical protein